MHSTCRVQTLKVMRFLFWDIKKERDKQQTKQMLFVKFPLKSFCSKCQHSIEGSFSFPINFLAEGLEKSFFSAIFINNPVSFSFFPHYAWPDANVILDWLPSHKPWTESKKIFSNTCKRYLKEEKLTNCGSVRCRRRRIAASAGRNPECPTAYRRSFDIHYIIGSKRFKCLCHFVIGSERPKITTNYAQYLLIQEITSASPCVCSVRNHRWSQNVARTKRWHTKRSWLRLLSLPHLWCHLWSIIVKNPGNTDSICFIYCICPPIEHR